MPFCYVDGDCAKSSDTRGYTSDPFKPSSKEPGVGGKWDYCAMAADVSSHLTQKGCHCLPSWEHNSKLYNNCSSTPDLEPEKSWCVVAEDAIGFGSPGKVENVCLPECAIYFPLTEENHVLCTSIGTSLLVQIIMCCFL